MIKKRIILSTIVCVFLSIAMAPVLLMFFKSIIIDGNVNFSYYQLLFNKRIWSLFQNSFILAFITTIVVVVVGLPLGLILGKSDLPMRKFFILLFTIPLLLPPYILAISWSHILGKQGVLYFISPKLSQIAYSWLFGLPGCVFVLTTVFMPVVMLLTITYTKTIATHLEEAARLFTRWPKILRNITVPLILPGVLWAAIIVFLLTFGEVSVPMFFRVEVFPVESFSQFAAFYDFGAATASAIPLVFIISSVFLVERFLLQTNIYQLRFTSANQLSLCLGPWRWWLFSGVAFLCFLFVILPIVILIVEAGAFANYIEALKTSSDSLIRSCCYAIMGAFVLTIIGFFLGYTIHTKSFRYWKILDSLTIFLFALPGTIIGIGLVLLWNHPMTNFIYQTPMILILGYLIQYIALTNRTTIAMLMQIPPSMEEAAQVSGVRWSTRITGITIPLARQGLLAGWLITYIFCMRDTGISMIVYPPGSDPLSVRIFTLMANSSSEVIAALCVIMVFATSIPLIILRSFWKKLANEYN